MKRRTKRILAALLALALTVAMAGCGRKKEVHKVDFQTAPAYAAENVPLPVEAGDLIGCCTDGENMYILIDEKTGEDEIRSVLTRVRLAEGTAEILEDYQSSNVPEGAMVNRLGPALAPDGTLSLYEMWLVDTYDLPEDFDESEDSKLEYLVSRDEFHHLRRLDPVTGKEKDLVDLSEAVRTLGVEESSAGGILDIGGFAVDGGGNVYFAKGNGVSVLDRKGTHLFTLDASIPQASFSGTSGGPLTALPDGTVAALTVQPGGKREARTIDASAKGWGSGRYVLPNGTDLLYSGAGGFLFFYASGGALCGWEPGAEEGRRLLSWSAADLPGVVMCAAPLDGSRAAALTLDRSGAAGSDDYWYRAGLRLSILSPTKETPSDGKVKLVYGTIGTNSLQRWRINEFNKTSGQYYIELRNYAGDGVELMDLDQSRRDAAKKLLNAEVVSGRAPDIWDTTLPTELYARKGLLEDLWPWIDGDPEIRREDLMSHVLECASVDGKLYRVFNSFAIRTAVASAELVGDRTGWTLEEMMDCYRSMPEGSSIFPYYFGKTGTLMNLLLHDVDYWIDRSSGECRFDSEEFKSLLEFCGREDDSYVNAEWGEERMANALSGADLQSGRQLMEEAILTRITDLDRYDALVGGPERLMDYEAYLSEYNIVPCIRDENGDLIEQSFYCQQFSQAFGDRQKGFLYGCYPLRDDTVFGAVDGGGYAVYVGGPASGGTGSSFELPGAYSFFDAAWGISAGCQNKEAAWSFVRQLLLPPDDILKAEGVNYRLDHFPVNKAAFDKNLEPRYFTYEDGTYALDKEGKPIEDPQGMIMIPSASGIPLQMVVYELAPSEAQLERFWKLYDSIDHMSSEEDVLLDLILEQAQPYFAGDKSLEDTASLIQSRATIYVNENR